jgi:hypothetical protein
MQSTTRLCATILAAAGILLVPAAYAQTQSPSAPSTTAQPTTFSDDKLDKAAAAAKDVSAIRNNYEQKLAQAPADEKQRLVGEADDAMTKAVTDKGLSVEEYMTIIKVAQNDAVVRDKLLQRLKE